MTLLRPILLAVLFTRLASVASADVAPVVVRVPEKQVWTGQRLPLFVELRARGSFDGAASFSLPAIPRTVLIKIGSPVVSSTEIDGESWFVQTHEFAIFSQKSGTLEIPSFEVRFASREGFTGPAMDQREQVPATRVEIKRPPDSDQFGFLVTSDSLEIDETWEPAPGAAEQGALFTRVISQQADQTTGMALAPPPSTVPAGVRLYGGQPEVRDNTERGSFVGERRDTLKYLFREPGTFVLPAVTYAWWDPKSEELRTQTLPEVTFSVAAKNAAIEEAKSGSPWLPWGFVLVIGTCGLGMIVYLQKERLTAWLRRVRQSLNPPDRVAARSLYLACGDNDAEKAHKAWTSWLSYQDLNFDAGPKLRSAVIDLQRHLYGPSAQKAWQGTELRDAFCARLTSTYARADSTRQSELPPLNPASVAPAPTRPQHVRSS